MKLHNIVQNEAIISNVGEVGEFRIRNSAKAFNILSSGLYANKIKAIIRELSCNAVDSHVAAGKPDTPFDVHLPNSLEPWFSIRDYGTGLSHDQVKNIYTTYFESTKTDSNEFIGALGLGSKSPFSYTDNFTVTAVKDNRKGIYTAFINEQGVPSIALMMEEQTTEPSGVEVRFAVESRNDFDKFIEEAKTVYKRFNLRPVISGNGNFKFIDVTYKEKDIIPGVHYAGNGSYYANRSYAIMGNIEYPIEIPNSEKVLNGLEVLLSCGLVMEFDIGELDFQASREGLSYIPETIANIKKKLEQLNSQLAIHVAEKANKIENLWDRANYLYTTRSSDPMFRGAIDKYVVDANFPLIELSQGKTSGKKMFEVMVSDLQKLYNIDLRVFTKRRDLKNVSVQTLHYKVVKNTVTQTDEFVYYWNIYVNTEQMFVINDVKVGGIERAKYHFRNTTTNQYETIVFVINPYDKTKPVKTKEFFDSISNPPEKQCFLASNLTEKPRNNSISRNVTIMVLREQYRSRFSREWKWGDGGKISNYPDSETYYYVELKGWTSVDTPGDVKNIRRALYNSGLYTGKIYGVRKADIDSVRGRKNWVNLNEFIKDKLGKLDNGNVMGLVKHGIDFNILYKYNAVSEVTNINSPYVKLYNEFKDVKEESGDANQHLKYLSDMYKVTTNNNVDPAMLTNKYKQEVNEIYKRYPLIQSLGGWDTKTVAKALGEYINLIDSVKGV